MEKNGDPDSDGTRPRKRKLKVRISEKAKPPRNFAQAPEVRSSSSSGSPSPSSDEETGRAFFAFRLPCQLKWIPTNWTWSKLKPVVRCSIIAWIASVLFAIPAVEIWMGQASFLIMIAPFLSPPSDPFISVLEREVLILLFVTTGWAWACLGIKFADMARTVRNPAATLNEVIDGRYIEAAPSAIIGVFVAVGSAIILYVRALKGSGPYLFACVWSCVCVDIALTTAVFFPFPYYMIGKAIVIPLALHTALALLGSIVIFPSTISAQFTTRLQGVLAPLVTVLDLHRTLLRSSLGSLEFAEMVNTVKDTVTQSEASLITLAASGRLLSSDLIYCRFSPDDFRPFQAFSCRLTGRANGLDLYFTLIDPTRDKFPVTPATSIPNTPTALSRQHSPERESLYHDSEGPHAANVLEKDISTPCGSKMQRGHVSPTQSFHPGHSRTQSHQTIHSHRHSHPHPHHLHSSLQNLGLKLRHRKLEHAVGVFESHRYLNLEATRLHDPKSELYTLQTTELLSESCDPLLEHCSRGLVAVTGWLGGVRKGRLTFFKRQQEQRRLQDNLEKLIQLRESLSSVLEDFRQHLRHKVLEPYRPAFEHDGEEEKSRHEMPPHQHLFHCYVYQYHLIQIAGIILEMLDEIIRLEKERKDNRLWTPVKHIFKWSRHEVPENVENDDDDDPDIIQGAHSLEHDDIGLAKRRDPDALPPRNVVEWLMNHSYHIVTRLGSGNAVFALKAGLLSAVLCLPFLIKDSAKFAFENRYVWSIFMGQLTLARFRGDTTFSLTARIIATFIGGVVGMVMWYASCGSGSGNAYGLAAVCAVCFPFFFYVVLYCPAAPLTILVGLMTAILVVGYSYQDLYVIVPGSPGFGWSVAWRRFVLVTIGVVAAFIASFFPPSTTLKGFQRKLLSTTCSELGNIYCSIITSASSKREASVQEIISSLIATRSKLKRSLAMRTNIMYEFSLRGRWPAARYEQLFELQMAISYSLSHLMSVMEHLEPAWARAFLRRARFLDPDFQGDVLAVIAMISSSLRTGCPLPQVTPCPLLDKFMMRYHGLDVIHKDSEDDYGLPRLLTLDTLQNEQYMIFCVGISTACGIMNRLDRLMVAAKEIVGEQFHIHGVGVSSTAGEEVAFHSPSHFRPQKDV